MTLFRASLFFCSILLLSTPVLHAEEAASAYPRDNDEDYMDNYYHAGKAVKKAPTPPPVSRPAPVYPNDSDNVYNKYPADNDSEYKPTNKTPPPPRESSSYPMDNDSEYKPSAPAPDNHFPTSMY